jgi:hypothetical protein
MAIGIKQSALILEQRIGKVVRSESLICAASLAD